jgi:hypothetical protein
MGPEEGIAWEFRLRRNLAGLRGGLEAQVHGSGAALLDAARADVCTPSRKMYSIVVLVGGAVLHWGPWPNPLRRRPKGAEARLICLGVPRVRTGMAAAHSSG